MMQIFLELIGMVPLFTVVGLVVLKARQLKADDRRDPITTELRCLPGNSLQENLDNLTDWRMDRVVLALTAGMLAALFIATRRIGNSLSWRSQAGTSKIPHESRTIWCVSSTQRKPSGCCFLKNLSASTVPRFSGLPSRSRSSLRASALNFQQSTIRTIGR